MTWVPALSVLGASLVGAMIFALRTKRASAQARDPVKSADAERVRQSIEQLRELEAERHLLSADAYAARKLELETQAAEALRRNETHAPSPPVATPEGGVRGNGFFARHPHLVGAVWGGGTVLFLAGLVFSASRDQKPREPTPVATAAPAQPHPDISQALNASDENPLDVEAAAEAAHLVLRGGTPAEAEVYVHRALAVDPFHSESRVHRAVIWAAQGDERRAREELQRLSRSYPDAHEADLFLGMFAASRNDFAAALQAWERFVARAPSETVPPQLREAIRQLRTRLGSGK
ncbi:MAG: tetratricopeptide repeat protein [Myxococcaceae bacterium]